MTFARNHLPLQTSLEGSWNSEERQELQRLPVWNVGNAEECGKGLWGALSACCNMKATIIIGRALGVCLRAFRVFQGS